MSEAGANFSRTLEACFSGIARTRMEGVPILNPKLSVEAVATRSFGDGFITILVTPWFMNVVLREAEGGEPVRVGAKRTVALPAGRFEFIRGYEETVGGYWSCSLYSPMFEFEDHAAAVATAAAAMEELFGTVIAEDEDERGMAMMWRGEVPSPRRREEDVAGEEAPLEAAQDAAAAAQALPAAKAEYSRRGLFSGLRAAAPQEREG